MVCLLAGISEKQAAVLIAMNSMAHEDLGRGLDIDLSEDACFRADQPGL